MREESTDTKAPAARDMEVYPVLDKFFQTYLTERNIEGTLSLLTDDVYTIGTGEKEVTVSKEQFERLLQMEVSSMPEPIQYMILDYREKEEGCGLRSCHCQVMTMVEKEEILFYQTRFSAIFRKVEDRWMASSLHMSEPSKSQASEEFFPLRFLSRQMEKLNGQTQKMLLDIMCRMLPCGILGRYLEEGFPLYVVNDTLLGMAGYSYEEFVAAAADGIINVIHEDDAERITEKIMEKMKTESEYTVEYRMKKKNGECLWVHDVGRKIITGDGRDAVISVLLDISGDIQNRMRLMEESSRDFLTEVYNRRGGEMQISEKMKIPMPYTFFMIDLDNFKQVNDLYGHDEGDKMLRYTGGILKQIFRQSDVVIRVGGDEFAVLAYPCSDIEAIKKKADNIIRQYDEEARARYPLSGTTVSIGGIYGSRPRTFLELYKLADQVLYEVKGKKDCCEIWEVDRHKDEKNP